jgi:dethiobiotin synthetase
MVPGLFVVGTDTGVGKTAVAVGILRWLVATGRRVGAYKPVATGITTADAPGGDPFLLWEAADRPLSPRLVCPQVFAAPLSPPRSSRAEGRQVNDQLLREGLAAWRDSQAIVVEGAGGLFSPLGEATLGADLARDLRLPVVIVDAARLGGIGRTLCCVRAARAEGLHVAACVFSEVVPPASLPEDSRAIARHTAADLAALLPGLPVTSLWHGDHSFDPPIDWWRAALTGRNGSVG